MILALGMILIGIALMGLTEIAVWIWEKLSPPEAVPDNIVYIDSARQRRAG